MSNLDRLFFWRGISDSFYNFKGQHTFVPLENRLKLLGAMGVDTSSDAAIAEEVFKLDIKPWLSWVPPLIVSSADKVPIDLSFAPEDINRSFNWRLEKDGDIQMSGNFIPAQLEEVGDYHHQGRRFSRRRYTLGDMKPDYYELTLETDEKTESCTLAASPKTAFIADWASDNQKLWGFVIQLYTLRSDQDWGIGDFSCLRQLIDASAGFGVDIIGLNPFHTLQPDLAEHHSPYSPSDRRFLNPLYIDVERAPGYEQEFKQEQDIDALRKLEHIDYPRLKAVKYPALYACFENFLFGDVQSFITYLEKAGDELIRFANFEVANSWNSEDAVGISIAREALIEALKDENGVLPIEMRVGTFHCYLQWVAEIQLESCQHEARSRGMKVGLLRDLAVGANGGGSEVRTHPELFCDAAAIGAPPDPLALTGQNWGVPPMDPAEMRRTGFQHVRRLFRENMKHCGALRIDHAMSLYRLWWCPPGETADMGSYVYYPFDELMGILCLESYLNQTAVVAEDLGIVPDEFRRAMSERALYSNKVFYFEKWHDTQFKLPKEYEPHALAMTNNHDVPTMLSWWNETDLVLRDRLSLLEPGVSLEEVIAHRREEKRNLLGAINSSGSLPENWGENDVERPMDWGLQCSILKYTATCASQFFVIQLEDALMMDDPVNVPGTFKEHQNWSRKLNKTVEQIFNDAQICSLFKQIDETRQAAGD